MKYFDALLGAFIVRVKAQTVQVEIRWRGVCWTFHSEAFEANLENWFSGSWLNEFKLKSHFLVKNVYASGKGPKKAWSPLDNKQILKIQDDQMTLADHQFVKMASYGVTYESNKLKISFEG